MRRVLTSLTVLSLCLALLASCNQDPEYEQLNLESDCFDVEIAPEGSVGDDDDSAGDDDDSAAEDAGAEDLELSLVARPGLFADDSLGTAYLSPASGPAGTRFFFTVVVADNGLESGNPTSIVDRVAVKVDNGALTVNEFDMEPSPADESRWTLTIAAGGDPVTASREDRLCIAVYAEIE